MGLLEELSRKRRGGEKELSNLTFERDGMKIFEDLSQKFQFEE